MRSRDVRAKIKWCSELRKGIKVTEPNDNLCKAYLKKSNTALRAMNLNMGAGLHDWAVDGAYYARYHAIYALLRKCGIESEIHDCTIALVRFLFRNRFARHLLEELETAKSHRIDLVYYTDRMVPEEGIKRNIASAPDFVLHVEKTISSLNNREEITRLRQRLKQAILR